MRHISIIIAALMLGFATNISAQSEKKSLGEKVGSAAGKTAYQVEKGAKKVGNTASKGAKAIGKTAKKGYQEVGKTVGYYDPMTIKDDLVKVRGSYYMHVYDINLYHAADGKVFRDECLRQFELENPGAVVLSTAIPQTDWLTSPVVKEGVHIANVQYLYCYITAYYRGEFINARFSFKRHAELNGKYQPLQSNWPKWDRTDRMDRNTFGKVLQK